MSAADKLKDLMMKIPGYRGYAEKEERRAADKELREAVAAAFSSQVTRITRVQEQMMKQGDFDNLEALDAIITRLQHLSDRIRTASYGFSGLFDSNRVDEAVLERLYAFDLQLASGIEQTADLIAQLGLNERVPDFIDALRDKLDELHHTFDQRAHILSSAPSLGSAPTPLDRADRAVPHDPSGETSIETPIE